MGILDIFRSRAPYAIVAAGVVPAYWYISTDRFKLRNDWEKEIVSSQYGTTDMTIQAKSLLNKTNYCHALGHLEVAELEKARNTGMKFFHLFLFKFFHLSNFFFHIFYFSFFSYFLFFIFFSYFSFFFIFFIFFHIFHFFSYFYFFSYFFFIFSIFHFFDIISYF